MTRTCRSISLAIALFGTVGVALPASTAIAQDAIPAAKNANPKRDTLMRLSRDVTINLENQRLQDVVSFLESYSGAPFDALWIDDVNSVGLDPDMEVSVKVNNVAVIDLIERLMVKAGEDVGEPDSFTWQLAEDGSLEIGPKERLNKRKRLVIYDINDLIIEIPDYSDAPEFDLQSVLQNSSGGGGGGGQSPFTGQTAQRDVTPKQNRANDIIALMTTLIEPDQWVDNGGDGASVRFYQNNLVVRAPDYIHRQIDGYPFWPRNLTRATYTEGRRNMDILPDPSGRKKGP
ncbi:MAG: hypothetical protein R3B57_08815 [Phycisphaerales bacterium]